MLANLCAKGMKDGTRHGEGARAHLIAKFVKPFHGLGGCAEVIAIIVERAFGEGARQSGAEGGHSVGWGYGDGLEDWG